MALSKNWKGGRGIEQLRFGVRLYPKLPLLLHLLLLWRPPLSLPLFPPTTVYCSTSRCFCSDLHPDPELSVLSLLPTRRSNSDLLLSSLVCLCLASLLMHLYLCDPLT